MRITKLQLLVVMSVLAICAPARGELRVVGTDLLGLEFSQALYGFAGPQGIELALAFDGSRPGVDALKLSRADLVLLVLPTKEEALGGEFESLVLGYHRVVVLVPATCPLERISLPQLAAIFGAGAAPNLARWGELGVTGDWTTSALAPAAPAVGTGLALEYFRHAVLGDGALRANVARYPSHASLAALFAADSRTLALAAGPPAGERAKILPVAAGSKAPAFLPTPENLHDGSYPLRLPLRAVYRRDALPKIRMLLRHLASDQIAPHLERAGVVPLPASARAQQAFALDAR